MGCLGKSRQVMVKDLVTYVVSWINIERSAAINQSVAPKVHFTGMRVDFRREFGLALLRGV
jgi:hypothetical protein